MLTKKIITRYQEIIELEKQLKTEKNDIRNTILESFPSDKLEGTDNYQHLYYKIKVTRKLKRTLDVKAYEALELPANLQFVDYKPSINLKRMRSIEMVDPDLLAKCITVEPATPTLTIEEAE